LGFPVAPLNWTDPETGDTTSGYREKGYFPDAVVNFLALLGWNPGTPQEIFSLQELVESFSLERVSKAGAKFDFDKAKWFNHQYMMKHDIASLAQNFKTELESKGIKVELSFVEKVVSLVRERVTFPQEFFAQSSYLFQAPTELDMETLKKKWKENTTSVITGWKNALAEVDNFTSSEIEQASKAYFEQSGVGIGSVLQVFRILVTGIGAGPGMFDICALLGKDEVLRRIENNLEKANA
jgi:glutamyl-tRNA synthetase